VSFEVIPRGLWQATDPLKTGQCAIDRDGRIMFRSEDLELVKIGGFALVLADTSTLRLAVRPPHAGEAARAMQVTVMKKKSGADTKRRAINVKRAIKALCLDPAAVKGRYNLTTKNDLLIVNLAGIELGPGAKKDE